MYVLLNEVYKTNTYYFSEKVEIFRQKWPVFISKATAIIIINRVQNISVGIL